MAKTLRDHLGRQVVVSPPAKRIVSLCPSLTETLFALGAGASVVGRTRYCTRPAGEIESIPAVGGTKTVDIERILALEPDLVIASREENEKEQIEALAEKLPVFVVEVNDFADALRAVRDLGELAGRSVKAAALADEIDSAFSGLQPLTPPLTTAYLVWREPYMAAGAGTYIDSLLGKCGLVNVFLQMAGRYPQVTLQELAGVAPRLVLLGSEPYPFDQSHIAEIRTALPRAAILLADGEMFAWYGARMLEAVGYLTSLAERIERESTRD